MDTNDFQEWVETEGPTYIKSPKDFLEEGYKNARIFERLARGAVKAECEDHYPPIVFNEAGQFHFKGEELN